MANSHKEKVTNQNSTKSSHSFLYSDFNQIFQNKNNHKKICSHTYAWQSARPHTHTPTKNQHKKNYEGWHRSAKAQPLFRAAFAIHFMAVNSFFAYRNVPMPEQEGDQKGVKKNYRFADIEEKFYSQLSVSSSPTHKQSQRRQCGNALAIHPTTHSPAILLIFSFVNILFYFRAMIALSGDMKKKLEEKLQLSVFRYGFRYSTTTHQMTRTMNWKFLLYVWVCVCVFFSCFIVHYVRHVICCVCIMWQQMLQDLPNLRFQMLQTSFVTVQRGEKIQEKTW